MVDHALFSDIFVIISFISVLGAAIHQMGPSECKTPHNETLLIANA